MTMIGELTKNLKKKFADPPCLGEALRRVIFIYFSDFWKKKTRTKFSKQIQKF